MVSIEERIKQKAKRNLDLQILKAATPLLDFISMEFRLSGNQKLSEFLKSVQILEELLSKELTEKWEQEAIDNFKHARFDATDEIVYVEED